MKRKLGKNLHKAVDAKKARDRWAPASCAFFFITSYHRKTEKSSGYFPPL
ncbi:MAG: hypothetical protein IJX37_01770 [Oscillospiraceae bacterium]|nr:hypothetical protein [Oscillospiraceae bacterium]